MTHISDDVRATLTRYGFTVQPDGTFRRAIATGGTFGTGCQLVRLDASGRWLERVDGWGTVEVDTDLRRWPNDPAGALEAIGVTSD